MPTRTELDFAAVWLRGERYAAWPECCAATGRGYLLSTRSTTGEIVLTPAGADLLATIETLGIDPETARADDDPPEPEERFCAKCGNTGEIPIIGEFCNPCPDCAKHALRQVFKDELRLIAPTPYPYPVPGEPQLCAAQLDGWTLIDSAETAKRFVGKTVKLDAARISGLWPEHPLHRRRVVIDDAQDGMLYFTGNTGSLGISWARRGNVRLREVRDPIATAARQSQQNDWTLVNGSWRHTSLLGISGVVVPEPQPDPDPPGFGED